MEMYKIVEENLDIEKITALVSSPSAGAICTFTGVTRNYTGDKKVLYLHYEAYPTMALKQMKLICDEVKDKFPVRKIAIYHRIGRVDIEKASVVIAVSSGHRREAFEACHYAIDRLKEIVPVWKKEFMEGDEEEWVANCCHPDNADKHTHEHSH
jgi:molybdopterin synthase catalytic subunit